MYLACCPFNKHRQSQEPQAAHTVVCSLMKLTFCEFVLRPRGVKQKLTGRGDLPTKLVFNLDSHSSHERLGCQVEFQETGTWTLLLLHELPELLHTHRIPLTASVFWE